MEPQRNRSWKKFQVSGRKNDNEFLKEVQDVIFFFLSITGEKVKVLENFQKILQEVELKCKLRKLA